jgi:hypothetical protein
MMMIMIVVIVITKGLVSKYLHDAPDIVIDNALGLK